MTSFRDKTYVRTTEGLLFNVTGYDHSPGFVFGSLKYVQQEKWTKGYAAACQYLAARYPQYVDEYIQIPLDAIEQTYEPQRRWQQLLAQRGTLEGVLAEAVELGERLRSMLDIPLSSNEDHDTEFGITDSLLWGSGHANSDIDLVVVGTANARNVQRKSATFYDHPEFLRPDPDIMRAPYGLRVDDWPQILARKLHMGSFRGRLFSLRSMLSVDELAATRPQINATTRPGRTEVVRFTVDDVSRSLMFPAVYRNRQGDELVDYSVVYEGVFRVGDVVECKCTVETADTHKRLILEAVYRWQTA